ncbi:MAG: heterodisulfide reductase-related iron-sulfur binding cluster, partial [Pseudomonadota bacterium]|nr:heterodisulfide reductase-related iron-sulfur binding cluster [Pseudomonadota bacterium]
MIGAVLPHPSRFLLLLRLAKLARSISGLIPKRLRVMLMLAPSAPSSSPLGSGPVIWPAEGKRRKRVLLMQGCVQQVLAARINEATVRLLTRLGCEVIVAKGSGCCGAIAHHVGQEKTTKRLMRANVDAWTHEIDLDQAADNVDAIIVNASGCGTMVKDYAFILRNDKAYAEKSRRISELTRDVSEFVSEMDVLPNSDRGGLRVTYHSACSLQHGQEITATPQKLLATLGFNVSEPDEAHLCCGSAGTYNLMQPEIASQLRDRKVAHISRTLPDVIATGNIGCMIQIQDAVEVPVLHTVELLDWGTGGPRPEGLKV